MSIGYPITTFLLPFGVVPKQLLLHYLRLQQACQHLGVTLPWASYNAFEAYVLTLPLNCAQKQLAVLNQLVCRIGVAQEGVCVALRQKPEGAGVRLMVVEHALRLSPGIKTSNYQLEQQLLEEAEGDGCNDILRITPEGFVAETAYSNVFAQRRDGQWLTPDPQHSHCLWGTEAQWFVGQQQALGHNVKKVMLPLALLISPQIVQCVLTNAVRGVQKVEYIKKGNNTWCFKD